MRACRASWAIVLGIGAALAGNGTENAADGLVAAERAFAAAALERGVRDAFLEHLAEGAILFRPGPVDGPDWMRGQPAPPGTLSWEPRYAEVSRSGDLGFTHGPWTYRDGEGEAATTSHGSFVSVWRRGDDGRWRVGLDIGVRHPEDDRGPTVRVRVPEGAAAEPLDHASVLEAERRFADRMSMAGPDDACREVGASDLVVFREDSMPANGIEAGCRLLTASTGAAISTVTAAAIAPSGDLAYAYGRLDPERPPRQDEPPPTYSYLRIWRQSPTGHWTLALDLALPR